MFFLNYYWLQINTFLRASITIFRNTLIKLHKNKGIEDEWGWYVSFED